MHIKKYGRKSEQPIKVRSVEKHYNVKYIGDFCIKTKDGIWSESPVAIFYQPNPDTSKGHTHYMGVFCRHGSIYLCNGESAFSEPITGIVANDGEVIYSRYRWDYQVSTDKSVFIDGGRDYTKSSVNSRFVDLVIDKNKLKININKIKQ